MGVHAFTRRGAAARRDAAARRIQTLWRRRDPLRGGVVRRPYWIFRGDEARPVCYDAGVLHAYVEATGDLSDVMCRVPYTRAELLGLAWFAGRSARSLDPDLLARRREATQERTSLENALENAIGEAVQRVAAASGDAQSFMELSSALADARQVLPSSRVDAALRESLAQLRLCVDAERRHGTAASVLSLQTTLVVLQQSGLLVPRPLPSALWRSANRANALRDRLVVLVPPEDESDEVRQVAAFLARTVAAASSSREPGTLR